MMRISLKAHKGQYLKANIDEVSTIVATSKGIGPRERFSLINQTRDDDTLRSGDKVSLQTDLGKFVVAEGGGGREVLANRLVIGPWETFIIEKVAGSGIIVHGDHIALKSNRGRYLVAEDGGGREVLANRDRVAEWETFTLEFWTSMLVRLRSNSGHFLVAEGGGGRELRADRTTPATWETFALVNRSGRRGELLHGDLVSIQVWDGHFVAAEGGGGREVIANRNTAGAWETFKIERLAEGPGAPVIVGKTPIVHKTRVALRASNGQYLVAENGGGREVLANRDRRGAWETFIVELAELVPIAFDLTPSASVTPGHPLSIPPTKVAGTRPLLTLLVEYSDMPADDTLTVDHVRAIMFGSGRTVQRWIELNSHGAQTISDAGVYGPLKLPHPRSFYNDMDEEADLIKFWTAVLDAAESAQVPLPKLDVNKDGTITTDEVHPVVFDFSNVDGGSQRGTTVMTRGEISYTGSVIAVGLYSKGGPIQGAAQLAAVFRVIVHELGHGLFGLPDRSHFRAPLRGDVVANRNSALAWEHFEIQKLGGSAQLSYGDSIALRAHNFKYLVAEGGGGGFINADRDSIGAWETFKVQKIASRVGGSVGINSGSVGINNGDQIALKASNGQFLVAEEGGGREVLANRDSLGKWETFKISGNAARRGIQTGDSVTLQAANGQFVVAETNKRTTDPAAFALGYEWEGGSGVGGGFDIMDSSGDAFMCTYDRFKLGWLKPRVLTPEYRSCYVLQPSSDAAEALVLWDPVVPDEWYLVENRQRLAGLDEVPSSGITISWTSNKVVWEREFSVISAAAPRTIPDPLLAQLTLDPVGKFRRHDPQAAFTSGQITLLRGDGTPSRFHLSFRRHASNLVVLCIN